MFKGFTFVRIGGLLGSASLVLCACAGEPVAQNNIDSTETVTVGATVGQLKTRNYLLTVYAGSNGPLYTVVDKNGDVRGVQMPPSLLAERFPVLKSIVDNPADGASVNKDFRPTRQMENN